MKDFFAHGAIKMHTTNIHPEPDLENLFRIAYARFFHLPEDFSIKEIEEYLSTIPDSREKKVKMTKAQKSVMMEVMCERNKHNSQQRGYSPLREPLY